jgi:Kef-type K+ transport system membrane component KefB
VLLVAMASFDPSTKVFIFNVLLVGTWLLEELLFWIDKDVVEDEDVIIVVVVVVVDGEVD